MNSLIATVYPKNELVRPNKSLQPTPPAPLQSPALQFTKNPLLKNKTEIGYHRLCWVRAKQSVRLYSAQFGAAELQRWAAYDMTEIQLTGFDYDNPKRYWLNRDSGVWNFEAVKDKEGASKGTCGFADVRKIGLWLHHEVFVAIFTNTKTAVLRINSVEFDLNDPSMKVSRKWLAPCIKRFNILHENKLKFAATYSWCDVHEWPDDDVLDIFYYINTHLDGSKQINQFITFWSLSSQGLSPIEIARRLNHEK